MIELSTSTALSIATACVCAGILDLLLSHQHSEHPRTEATGILALFATLLGLDAY